MLAPGGYIRRISSYFCRNLVILPEFIGKCKFILLRAKIMLPKSDGSVFTDVIRNKTSKLNMCLHINSYINDY